MSLGNVIEEQHNGLASTFTVICSQCNVENTIKTSKEHRSGARGPLTFDVNTRAALGCLHTGVGNTHLNNLLSTLNVPAMNSSTFKNRGREAGKAIELVAKKSCQQFLNLEQEKAIENGNKPDQDQFGTCCLFLRHGVAETGARFQLQDRTCCSHGPFNWKGP